MDSFVLRWRALFWGRVWLTVLAFTLAWSIGVGLAVWDLTPVGTRGVYDCMPGPLHPLASGPGDLLWLPVRALVAAPFGLYLSGLTVLVVAYVSAIIPAYMLPQGTARRVLGGPLVGLLAALLLLCGWYDEVGHIRGEGLPPIACSASGF